MKRTKKFIAAEKIALNIGVNIDDNIYKNLEKQGFFWFKHSGEWLSTKNENPLIPLIEVRVTSNTKTIDEDCSDIIDGLNSSFVVQTMSKPYSCRPPQGHKSNIYLRIFRRK